MSNSNGNKSPSYTKKGSGRYHAQDGTAAMKKREKKKNKKVSAAKTIQARPV